MIVVDNLISAAAAKRLFNAILRHAKGVPEDGGLQTYKNTLKMKWAHTFAKPGESTHLFIATVICVCALVELGPIDLLPDSVLQALEKEGVLSKLWTLACDLSTKNGGTRARRVRLVQVDRG